MEYPSKLIECAVNEFCRLPGIGRKTALRLVLYLIKQPREEISGFGEIVGKLADEVSYCTECHNLSDLDVCCICSNTTRDNSVICIVEDVRDVMAIENTNQYKGVYHVLNGLISPMDGIGPDHLTISQLVQRLASKPAAEIIFALNATMEGDTTMFYITKKVKELNVKVSTLSRGIAVGGELEYADEVTLGRSIVTRIPYAL